MKGNSYNQKIKKTGKKVAVTTLVAALGVSVMPYADIPIQVYAEESLMTQTIDGMVIENGVLKRYEGNAAEVIIPEGVISIGEYAFAYKDFLESVTIPESVTEIQQYAFYKCGSLESVEIQGTIDQIDLAAFSTCSKLSRIDLSQVKEFGVVAFGGCTSLKSIELNNVQMIKDGAFCGTGIESAVLHFTGEDAVLGHDTFEKCQNLKTVTITGNLSKIESGAFLRCEALEDIRIENPNAITSIGERAFERTPWLKEQCSQSENKMLIINHILVSYLPNVYYAGAYDGIPYEELSEEEERTKMTEENFTYTEPEGVEMETVTIPADITKIADRAFYGAYSVKEIQFDPQIKNIEIGDYAFDFTTWQKEYLEKEDFLIIGGKLVKIKCNAEVLQVPNGVKKISIGAFRVNYATGKLPTEEVVQPKEIIWPKSVEDGPVYGVYGLENLARNWDIEKIILPTTFMSYYEESWRVIPECFEFEDVDTGVEAKDLLSGYNPENTPTPTAPDEPEETPTPTITQGPALTPAVSSTPIKDAILVHFKSPEGEPRLSFWNGSGEESDLNSWSQVDMEPEADGWYRYILGDMQSTSVIFKTSEGDTEKQYVVAGEWWYDSGLWYDEKPETIIAPTDTPKPTITTEPSITMEPTATVEPSITTEPTATVNPSITTEPAATVKPTVTTEPTAAVKPTVAVQPVKTPTPVPAKTPAVKVKKAVISKVKRTSETKIKVTMKKTEKVKGYQIVASTDKKFKKNVKKVTITGQSVTLKKLKKGKTYYVKARAYKLNSDKKKIYGKYSSVKKISK